MSAAADQLLIALANRMSGPQQQFNPADFAALLKKEPARRLDMSGNEITGDQNPFSNGFFKSGAADLSPEARLASQGGSAMNQWGMLGALPGVDAEKLGVFNDQRALASALTPKVPQDRAAGAIAASPSPWQSMESQGYEMVLPKAPPRPASGTPAAGAWMDLMGAQSRDMAAPGGLNQFWQKIGGPLTTEQAQANWAPFAAKAKMATKKNVMRNFR